MNLLLLYETDRHSDDETHFSVTGRRAKHLAEVLEAEPGSTVRVGLLDGPLGAARVQEIGADSAVLEVSFEALPPPRPRTDLILAVPRPKFLKRLLPEVAAMGIGRLVLLRTWRVQKPYLSTDVMRPEVYRPLLHLGLMQGGSTREPEVIIEDLFKPFLEDRVGRMFAGHRKMLAHPKAKTPISKLRLGRTERVVVVVGPEGGLIPYEVEQLERAGFEAFTMGERILRVDTACVALLAQLELLRNIS